MASCGFGHLGEVEGDVGLLEVGPLVSHELVRAEDALAAPCIKRERKDEGRHRDEGMEQSVAGLSPYRSRMYQPCECMNRDTKRIPTTQDK